MKAAMPAPRPGPAGRPGFTLVELLVVVTLMALLSTMAVSAVVEGRTGAASTVRVLAELHERAREVAVTRATDARLTLDLVTGAWVVTLEGRERTVLEGSGRIEVSEDVHLESPAGHRVSASWDALGRGRGPLLAVRDGGHEYGLFLDPWTGAAEVIRVR